VKKVGGLGGISDAMMTDKTRIQIVWTQKAGLAQQYIRAPAALTHQKIQMKTKKVGYSRPRISHTVTDADAVCAASELDSSDLTISL
jgi:hypothetical protein